MVTSLYIHLFLPLLVILTLVAWRLCARTEMLVGICILIGYALTELTKADAATKFINLEVGVLVADLALFVALLIITVRVGHWWLICASAFQFLATTGHLAKALVPGFSRMAYALMEGASSYPLLIALAVGIWQDRDRKRLAGRL